jgi:iron complex transport system substrate-binding protein
MVLRRWVLVAVLLAAFGGSAALKRAIAGRPKAAGGPPAGATRIVSLAPSLTEIAFELGLGDRVVAVTRYCTYPPEARSKPQIGGYYDPSYEAVMAAKPDLVLTLTEHEETRRELAKLGLRTLTADHFTVRGVLDSIVAIGAACGCPERAAALRDGLEARIRDVGRRTAGRPKPRVLLSIGRMGGDASLNRITVCGRNKYFEELLALAGGTNAFEGDLEFPSLSAEGVLQANPDVVIELWPDLKEKGLDPEPARKQWSAIPGFRARVHVIGESYVMVPGPRMALLVEDIARAIHPEVVHD